MEERNDQSLGMTYFAWLPAFPAGPGFGARAGAGPLVSRAGVAETVEEEGGGGAPGPLAGLFPVAGIEPARETSTELFELPLLVRKAAREAEEPAAGLAEGGAGREEGFGDMGVVEAGEAVLDEAPGGPKEAKNVCDWIRSVSERFTSFADAVSRKFLCAADL